MAEKHVCFLGDSILNRLAKQILKKTIYKTEDQKNFYELAVSGQCASELVQQLELVKFKKPKVLIMIGTNDILKKNNPQSFNIALQAILLNKLKGKQIILCNLAPIPRLKYPNALVQQYNDIIKSFGSYSNVTFVDIHNKFLTDDKSKIIFDYFENDQLHPNKFGLQQIWDEIRKNL